MQRILFCTFLFMISLGTFAQTPAPACRVPDFLKKGDKVALLSPSSYVPLEEVEDAARVLKKWGLEPVIGASVGRKAGLNDAGTLQERLDDLHRALADPEVKAILCNRGGYSTIHMLSRLDPAELSAHPKWLIGFSDITTLHGMEVSAGVMSIHGTMSRFIGKSKGKDISSTALRDLLFGTVPRYELPAHPCNIPGKASGTLVGGNLCTLYPLQGTAVDFTDHPEGFILFLEEVEESYHNLDRILNKLILGGMMEHCKGVILGYFTDCPADRDFESVEQMFRPYFEPYGIPLLCGFPAGHDSPNLPLIMGAPVTMEVTETGADVRFDLPDTEQMVLRIKEPQIMNPQ